MLMLAFTLLLASLTAALIGFTNSSKETAGIARSLFYILLLFSLFSLFIGLLGAQHLLGKSRPA
jgi:uncharacterized membrane protein YtjA (UPF0391 family)